MKAPVREIRLSILLIVTLAGCTRDADPDSSTNTGAARSDTTPIFPSQAFAAPPSRAGRLVLTASGLRFLPCGERGDGLAIEDLANGEGRSLVREFGGEEAGVVVMIRLHGHNLREIRYAGPEGATCDQLPPEGEIEARGNEPFWFIRVEGARATVRTPEELDGVEYRGGNWSRSGDHAWRYEARRQSKEGEGPLILEISETRCADGMSGAKYPLRAVLTREGRRMEGCALEGRHARHAKVE